MATTTTRMQQRRDTTADWEYRDPVLLLGELGYDTDEKRFKIGDGETPWTSLDFLLDAELEAAQASADAAAESAAAAAASAAGIPSATDPVVAGLVDDRESETATVMDSLYAHLDGDGALVIDGVAVGGGGGGGLSPDPDHTGYFIAGAGITPDPDHTGYYLIGA